MTEYHFTGAYPRVLTGLSQGVNAILIPAEGDEPPHGSTLEARTGDAIHTDEPYPHPELEEVIHEPAPTDEDGDLIPTPDTDPDEPEETSTPDDAK